MASRGRVAFFLLEFGFAFLLFVTFRCVLTVLFVHVLLANSCFVSDCFLLPALACHAVLYVHGIGPLFSRLQLSISCRGLIILDESAPFSSSFSFSFSHFFFFLLFLRDAGPLYARLQLSISCRGLVNLDKLSKSDPFVVSVGPRLPHAEQITI